jgi:hypothetical protein
LHCSEPGTHEPPQEPGAVPTVPTQAYWHVVAGVSRDPLVLQVSICVLL